MLTGYIVLHIAVLPMHVLRPEQLLRAQRVEGEAHSLLGENGDEDVGAVFEIIPPLALKNGGVHFHFQLLQRVYYSSPVRSDISHHE